MKITKVQIITKILSLNPKENVTTLWTKRKNELLKKLKTLEKENK